MPKNPLKEWERKFRNAANADNLSLFRDHLKRLALPDKPKQLLEGTILIVQAICAYAHINGQPCKDILSLQKYRVSDVPDAKYVFTFELCGKSFARIVLSKKIDAWLDLADLYGHPWFTYKVCGYNRIWVSRADGKALSAREKTKIEEGVTDDLRYDYSEDELGFWFDDSQIKGVLWVEVYDVEENDDFE